MNSTRIISNRIGHETHIATAWPTRLRRLGVALLAGSLLAASAGPGLADSPPLIPAQVRAVYTLADLGTNVETFCLTLVENAAAELANEASALHQQLDAAARTRWFSAIQASCVTEDALELHLAAFSAGYDAEAARKVTDWYTSEAGQRMLGLERAAASIDWDAEVLPFIDRITQEPVPVERVKLTSRINTASHATEDAALLQAGIASILTYGGRALQPEIERSSRALLDSQIESMRQQVALQMAAQQSVVFMFVYREASDADLEAFARFSESDAAQWLFASHRMGMLQLISQVREQIEARLGAS